MMVFRRGFLKGLLAALLAPKIVRAGSLFRGNPTEIYPDGWIEHPMTLTRIPVMLDGVVRYLKPGDKRLLSAEPLPERNLPERNLPERQWVPLNTEEWIKSRGEVLERGFKRPNPKPSVDQPFRLADFIQWRLDV
jgi:hypothetical protein